MITAFTVQTDNKELVFENVGGLRTANINIFGRIMAVSGKRSGIFEDSVVTYATTEELAEAKDKKSIYQKAVALAPGTYKVDVVVRDVRSGNQAAFAVSDLPFRNMMKTNFRHSTLILASTLRRTNRTRHRRKFCDRQGKSDSESGRDL